MPSLPHAFVLDLLYAVQPTSKKMFGVHSVYVGHLMVLALADRPKKPADNGVWVATTYEHHDALKAQIPGLVPLRQVPIKKWLLIPEDDAHFEESVQLVCEMILAGDERIGVLSKGK